MCGDGIRVGLEKCDNKNKTGCEGCHVVLGNICTGEIGQ